MASKPHYSVWPPFKCCRLPRQPLSSWPWLSSMCTAAPPPVAAAALPTSRT
uniref:Uncharacterized protein n=1 Tax=Arundo donax TaxID=35708 RepID=A0A0A9AQA7_ARUDO